MEQVCILTDCLRQAARCPLKILEQLNQKPGIQNSPGGFPAEFFQCESWMRTTHLQYNSFKEA